MFEAASATANDIKVVNDGPPALNKTCASSLAAMPKTAGRR
jgi:hypothetical protein